MRIERLLVLVALSFPLTGCFHGFFGGGIHFGGAFAHAPAALGHIAIAPAHVAIATAPVVAGAVGAARPIPIVIPPTPFVPRESPAPELDLEAPAPEEASVLPSRSFDAHAARASLERANLSVCRDSGLPRGWVHAKVTFASSGRARRIDLDAPEGLSAPAVACVGDVLAAATTRPFSGAGDVAVGVTSFVP